MTEIAPADRLHDRTALRFIALTFGIAWGVFLLFALFPDEVEALFGPPSGTHPLFALAVWAPAIAALVLVGRQGGRAGLRRFLGRFLLWRMPAGWWAVLLVGAPALFWAGAALKGGPLLPWNEGLGALLAALAFTAILGPVEELGWRGLLLPLVQRRMAPALAGLAVGLIWSLWHLPAFFLEGTPQAVWGFLPFLVGTTAASVILTGMFNAARGSLLIAALFHFQLNNPLWPDAQPWDMALFALAAVLVVWIRRDTMLRRGAGVTEVIPRSESGGTRP